MSEASIPHRHPCDPRGGSGSTEEARGRDRCGVQHGEAVKRQPEIDEFAARQLVAMRKRLIATVRGRADQLGKIAARKLRCVEGLSKTDVAELLRRGKMTARKAAATRKARTAIKAVRAGDKSR